jgi:hypothetical protein
MSEWLIEPIMAALAKRNQIEFSVIRRIAVDMMDGQNNLTSRYGMRLRIPCLA